MNSLITISLGLFIWLVWPRNNVPVFIETRKGDER